MEALIEIIEDLVEEIVSDDSERLDWVEDYLIMYDIKTDPQKWVCDELYKYVINNNKLPRYKDTFILNSEQFPNDIISWFISGYENLSDINREIRNIKLDTILN